MEILIHAGTTGLLSILVAFLILFLHYCIGEVEGNAYENGRIFSFWGRFVASGWSRFKNKESERIEGKASELKKRINNKYEVLWKKSMDIAEKRNLAAKQVSEIEAVNDKMPYWERLNYWNFLGACRTCFGTWVSMVAWGLFVAIGLNPLFWILGVCASVMISNRI